MSIAGKYWDMVWFFKHVHRKKRGMRMYKEKKTENWAFCPSCKTLVPLEKVLIGVYFFLMCKICGRILFEAESRR